MHRTVEAGDDQPIDLTHIGVDQRLNGVEPAVLGPLSVPRTNSSQPMLPRGPSGRLRLWLSKHSWQCKLGGLRADHIGWQGHAGTVA